MMVRSIMTFILGLEARDHVYATFRESNVTAVTGAIHAVGMASE
jgi:hypothetical protein